MAYTSDQKTVVGVFEDNRTAERVAEEVSNAGIPRDSIEVRSGSTVTESSENVDEGGISGFFHRLFGGHHYAEAIRRGSSVVYVTAPSDQVDRAVDIMNSAGAVDVEEDVEPPRGTDYQARDTDYQARDTDYQERGMDEGRSIPVVEEDLQVGKRTVQRGGVRVYSHVEERPVEENIELREEHVRVERRPVDRPADPREAEGLRDRSVEVTEMAEEPVVEKRARIREEVVLGKETTSRTEKVRDTVKHTEVDVEPIRGGGDEGYDYGYRMASDPRYKGRSWSEVENDVRSDYERSNPNSSWERVKDSVRRGWDKVTGRA